MLNILVTIFFGIYGVHRFIKKDYKAGFILMFTGGLFFVGWIHDIYVAFKDYFAQKEKENETYPSNKPTVKTKSIIATILSLTILLTSLGIVGNALPDVDTGYSSGTSDSYQEGYTNCKSCGKLVQRKFVYSGFCGSCYTKWKNAK